MTKKLSCKHWLVVVFLAISMVFSGACNNPFDPLKSSEEIKGLSYFDWAGSWERWDSDPLFDGFVIIMEFFNEFGDSLEFRDKPFPVIIQYFTQVLLNQETDPETGEVIEGSGTPSFDKLIFTYETIFEKSDDEIRIPRELYEPGLRAAGFNLGPSATESAIVFVSMRIFPPENVPQNELVVGYPDQEVWKPAVTPITPNP